MRNYCNMINICADGLVEMALSEGAKTSAEAEATLNKWIKSYTDNTDFGAILLNTNYHVSYIPSKVWDTAWERLDGVPVKYEDCGEHEWWKNYILAHQMGIEPFELAIKAIKNAGAKVFFSIRMNEFHYMTRWRTAGASLWYQRPDLRMAEDAPFDYENKEVRDYYLIYIKELCENYDIDGIELDYWRGQEFFKAPVTPEKTAIITEFNKEIRKEIDKISEKKGKRIIISARTHVHPEKALEKGWDSAAWVKNGSVDVLTLSNFFIPSTCEAPIEKWVELIGADGLRRSEYKINVCADMASCCIAWPLPELKWLLTNTEMMKGFGATHFDRGADGIYTFNILNRDYHLPMNEMACDFSKFGDINSCKEGKRVHILTSDDPSEYGFKNHLKAKLKAGEKIELKLHTSDKPEKGAYDILIGSNEEMPKLTLRLNGKVCESMGKLSGKPFIDNKTTNVETVTEAARCQQVFRGDLSVVKNGMNDFEIEAMQDTELTWFEVDIENI